MIMADSIQTKFLNIYIYQVLKDYSDVEHKLSRLEILNYLKKDYNLVDLDPKRITRNLQEMETCIFYKNVTRAEGKNRRSKWYLERDITDAELHLLIDSLLFSSKHIPYSQYKELVKKLENLSNIYFPKKKVLQEDQLEKRQLLLTIEVLNYAIFINKQVAFQLIVYGTDLQPHIIPDKDGAPHIYKVSPYAIIVKNGRFYLICAHAKGELFHYRLDYIHDIKLLDSEIRRSLKDVPGILGGVIDLAKYVREHIYMFSGKIERVRFRAYTTDYIGIIVQIIDWFGTKDTCFSDVTKDTVTVTVNVSEQAMLYWALQYGQSVEILSPDNLRKKVRQAAEKICERYNQ